MRVEKNRMDMLNLLRLIAFICVFLLHSKLFMPVPWDQVRFAWILYTPAWAGVWIFLILSGYGIGAGFYSGKYELSFGGVVRYYIKRLGKLIPLYWFYIFVVALFIKPDILTPSPVNYSKLLSLLLFHYQEEFDSLEFGLAWYLTTIVRLYILAPFFFAFSKRFITTRKRIVWTLVILVVGGLIARIGMGYHLAQTGIAWEVAIYKPFYFNLDLFFGGFLLRQLRNEKYLREISPLLKIGIFLLLAALIVFNCWINYFGSKDGNLTYLGIYRYLCPTMYAAVVCAYIYVFDVCHIYQRTQLNGEAIRRNPARVVDLFPKVQMSMYLFHSTVLRCMQLGYVDKRFSRYAALLNIGKERHINFFKSCLFTMEALSFTLLWAIIISYLFSRAGEGALQARLMRLPYEDFWMVTKRRIISILRSVFPEKKK